jgi:hypothetical protein
VVAREPGSRYNGCVSILIAFLVVVAVLILLTNTKRWKGLASGARRAKRGLEEEIKTPEQQ